MRFFDEIRSPADVELPKKNGVEKRSVAKFDKIISAHTADRLSKDELKDRKAAQMQKLIERKQRSEKNVVHIEAEEQPREKIVDLLDVLKKSLSQTPSKPAKSTAKARNSTVAKRRAAR